MSTTITEPVYHVELIDGCEIEKPLPKKLHFLVERYLVLVLSRILPDRYIAGPELNVLTGGRTPDGRREYIVPDVVVVDRAAKYEEGDLAEAPVLGVEILSPGQNIGDLFVRAERLLKLGCPMVWVVWPEKRQAWEYSTDSLREATTTLSRRLTLEDVVVEVELAGLWAALDA